AKNLRQRSYTDEVTTPFRVAGLACATFLWQTYRARKQTLYLIDQGERFQDLVIAHELLAAPAGDAARKRRPLHLGACSRADRALPLGRTGHEDIQVEPPRGEAHCEPDPRPIAAVRGRRMPESAVEDEDIPRLAACLHLAGIGSKRIHPVLAGRVVGGTMASG